VRRARLSSSARRAGFVAGDRRVFGVACAPKRASHPQWHRPRGNTGASARTDSRARPCAVARTRAGACAGDSARASAGTRPRASARPRSDIGAEAHLGARISTAVVPR